jgi:hypothetical protein
MTISSKPRCSLYGVITIGLSIGQRAIQDQDILESVHLFNLRLHSEHIVDYVIFTPGATLYRKLI